MYRLRLEVDGNDTTVVLTGTAESLEMARDALGALANLMLESLTDAEQKISEASDS